MYALSPSPCLSPAAPSRVSSPLVYPLRLLPPQFGEGGSAPKGGRHSAIFFRSSVKTLFVRCPPVQRQPDGLTIHTKKWFLGAGFLGAPPISLINLVSPSSRLPLVRPPSCLPPVAISLPSLPFRFRFTTPLMSAHGTSDGCLGTAFC